MIVDPTIDQINSALNSAVNYYATKFPNIVEMTDPNGTPDPNTGETPTISYNQTIYDLNIIANKTTSVIGGSLRPNAFTPPSSVPSEGEDTPIPYFTVPIAEALTNILTEMEFDSPMAISSGVFIPDKDIRESMYQKTRGVGELDACDFLAVALEMASKIVPNDLTTLDLVKSAMSSVASYCGSKVPLASGIINGINNLRTFYYNKCRQRGNSCLFSGQADYITHDFYTNSKATRAMTYFNPNLMTVFTAIEDTVAEIIPAEAAALKKVQAKYDSVIRAQVGNNKADELFATLDAEVNSQYLSNEITDLGTRFSNILTTVMLSAPSPLNLTTDLADSIAEFQVELQNINNIALTSYNIANGATERQTSDSDTSSHANMVSALKTAIDAFEVN